MTKAIAQTYNIANEYRTYITYALIAACLLMISIYGMNVYSVISRTVALQSVEKEAATLSSSVDSLDAQYIRLSSAITPDALSKHGLNQGHVSAFISRSASLGSVALSGHEL